MSQRRRWRLVAQTALTCALPAVGWGQYYSYQYATPQPYYSGYYGGGYHASTVQEGYARGMAEVIRSQGEKNLLDAKAATELEEARSKALDNRVKATKAYWERRRIYQENTSAERYARNEARRERRERVMLSDLTPAELNPNTGRIAWPMVLREDRFSEFRGIAEAMFAKRAETGALTSEEYRQAKALILQWRSVLAVGKDRYQPEPLSESLRFLLKLDRELDSNFG